MNRIVLLAAALALSPIASAQLYKYVDKDGKTVYTDQPPANAESKPLRIQAAPPTVAAPVKSSLDKDKDLEKVRKAEVDKAKKGEQAAKAAQDAEQRCAAARSNLLQYEGGGRVAKRNAAGERVFLEDKELEAEKQKARADVEEACKKG